MKKELWIHIDSYRPNVDAPANRAFAFARFFSEAGYKINIITNGDENRIEYRTEATVYYLKNKYVKKRKRIVGRLLENISFAFATRKFLEKNKKTIKDSIFILSIPEYISGLSCLKVKRYCAKFIVDVRDIWPEVAVEMGTFSSKSFKAKVFRFIADKYYKKCDLLMTVSSRKTDTLKRITKHAFDDKIVWIGNGYDISMTELISDPSVLNKYDLKNKTIVSYIGNIGHAQHLISLLEYAKEIQTESNKVFIISGKGSELDFLKKYSIDNNIQNVIFTGQVSKEQAKAITLASKISFISLMSDKMVDSVPTKLFESLGIGVPVLLVANGEACDILNKTGLGVSLLPSKIDELHNAFQFIEDNYEKIILNKNKAIKLMSTEYARNKYCHDLQKILEKI